MARASSLHRILATLRRETFADGTILYTGEMDGFGTVQRLGPGVVLMTAAGDFQAPIEDGPMQDFERELSAHGSLVLYLNLMDRKRVENSSRKQWTDWASANRERLQAHLLMKSKLVGMAINVMAMLAGGLPLTTYADVASFERAIAKDVPGFRRLPQIPAKARALYAG